METEQLAAALAHHRAGRLDEAAEGYARLLDRQPRHADALHMLGVLAIQHGRAREAVELIGRALAEAPDHPVVLFHLGQALRDEGQLARAIDAFERAARQQASLVPAHLAAGELHERLGAAARAEQCFRRAVKIAPQQAEGHWRLAALVARQGGYDEALALYRRAIELAPGEFEIHNNLGSLLIELGRTEEAIAAFEAALALAPQSVAVHLNLVSAWRRRRDAREVEKWCALALALAPDDSLVRKHAADAYLEQGDVETGRRHLARAVELAPRQVLWQFRLDTLAPDVALDNGAIDDYRRRLVERLPAWQGRLDAIGWDELAASGAKPPVDLAYQGRDERPIKSLFADLFAGRPTRDVPPPKNGKPRLGFVVTGRSMGVFARGMAGVLQNLDDRRFEVLLFAPVSESEAVARALAGSHTTHVPLAERFSLAAEQLAQGACDLLYFWETGTDCLNYYLPFLQLAPVQCTSWGWPVTSGNPRIQYFISSDRLEPAGAEAHYREQLVRLAHLPNYYPRPSSFDVLPDRARFGLAEDAHVYLCQQNPRKIHPDFDGLVADILRRDGRGLLVLLEAHRPHVTERLRERLSVALADCADRVRFLPRMTHGDYLQLIASADVVLDTIHYGGGANSTYDALAVGTPLVTLPTEFHRGRYAAAAYAAMDLADLVATSMPDYVERAIALASQPELRRIVQSRIRARRDVLFENLAAVRELEDFFERAVELSRR